ncbi:MAG: MFS transporter [Ignavibacteriales bacterium]|nr:MFS transporter [Ignavibacteriales bacterium]
MENTQQTSWKFPSRFWIANAMELMERAAYYGFFIVLTLYLTDVVGFNDIETGLIAGFFYGGIYLLPPFSGAIVDKIGFKKGLIIAFGLLTVGYFFLGILTTKLTVIILLVILMFGASMIKPLITGTVAKTTTQANRARGFSLFYWVVNIGAFGGKTVVPYIRQGIGLEQVNFFSAGMAFLALLFAIFVFKDVEEDSKGKSLQEVWAGLVRIFSNGKLIALTLIVAGFWIIQGQLYATMPKYVIRLQGVEAKPEWLANVNPLVVVIFVVLITQLMRKRKAVNSMFIGMLIMPLSALAMSLSNVVEGGANGTIMLFGIFEMYPLTLMMIIGIGLQGLAECFISPRFLEYFSLQAPKGEEGLYMGFSHLHSFFSAIAGFIMSGFLLDAYCPDPSTLPLGLTEAERLSYYANAHYIWYYFVGIGLLAAIALLIFKYWDKIKGIFKKQV